MSKAMVLFSGGVDSTTCLGLAIEKYGKENVIALSISYGQKHKKEVEAARSIAAYYGIELLSLDLQKIFTYSDCSLLEQSDAEVPKESYAEQLKETSGKPVSTYVPFRNGLFLASAASIALSKNCEVIYYGAQMMRQVTLIRIAAVPLTMQWDRQFIWEVAIRYVSRLRLSIGLRLKWSERDFV